MKKTKGILLLAFIISFQFIWAQKYGQDSVTCVQNVSLYREFYKQNNIKDATKHWKYVFLNCPQATKYTVVDGVNIMKYSIKEEKDKNKISSLIDTLLMVYDVRIKYFGEEGFVLGRKAVDMISLVPDKVEEVYNTFKKSVELRGNESEASVITYYLQATINAVKKGKIDTSLIFEVYDKVIAIADERNKTPKDTSFFMPAKANIESMFEPWAKCENLVPMYTKKFANSPDDLALLKKMISMLDKKGCTKEPIYLKIAEALYAKEPSSEAAYAIAKLYVAKEEWSNVSKYYQEAIEKEQDAEKKAKLYYELAVYQYSKQGQRQAAIANAKKAAAAKDGYGDPYILIGDIIGTTSGCGDNECSSRFIYWLAVDYYSKAKAIDASVSGTANGRIGNYSSRFPSAENCFFYNITEGASVDVPCYGEQTKARFK